MELFKWKDFLSYSSFVDRQLMTSVISEAVDPNQPSDEIKKKAARIKVEYASQLLTNKFPFFSQILFGLVIIYTYDPRIPTAATDGTRIFINPNFFFPMTQKQVLFVLAHEVMHIALLHTARMYTRDHKRWNIAADHEINLLLQGEQIIPRSEIIGDLQGYADEKYKGWGAEKIYGDPQLKTPPPPQAGEGQGDGDGQEGEGGEGGQGGGQGNGQGNGDGQEGEGGEGGQGEGQGDGQGGNQSQGKPGGNQQGVQGHSNNPITVIRGPKTGEVITKEEGNIIAKNEGHGVNGSESQGDRPKSDDDLKREIRQAAQRHLSPRSKSMGSGNNGDIYQRIMELTEPKVNWRGELSRIIGRIASKQEFKFPNRRFIASGEYRYGLQDEYAALDKAALALDVSGSIMSNFPELAAEVAGIVRAKKIKNIFVLPFADTVVTPFVLKSFKKPTADDFAKVRTGGGTEAIPAVIEYIDKHIKNPDFVVILTDGYITNDIPKKVPRWGHKIIWVIYDNPNFSIEPKWGRIIHANLDPGYFGR